MRRLRRSELMLAVVHAKNQLMISADVNTCDNTIEHHVYRASFIKSARSTLILRISKLFCYRLGTIRTCVKNAFCSLSVIIQIVFRFVGEMASEVRVIGEEPGPLGIEFKLKSGDKHHRR